MKVEKKRVGLLPDPPVTTIPIDAVQMAALEAAGYTFGGYDDNGQEIWDPPCFQMEEKDE